MASTRLLTAGTALWGLMVCICPNSTNMGDIQRLYYQLKAYRPDVGLRLIHYSYATLTCDDEITKMRLKYVELWFSVRLDDRWEVCESRGESTIRASGVNFASPLA